MAANFLGQLDGIGEPCGVLLRGDDAFRLRHVLESAVDATDVHGIKLMVVGEGHLMNVFRMGVKVFFHLLRRGYTSEEQDVERLKVVYGA